MGALNLVVGEPTNIKIGSYGTVEGSCADLGVTEGGLKLAYAEELFMKKADQYLSAVGASKISEDMKVEVMLAECTLQNLAYALGYAQTAISGSTLNVGGTSTVPEYTVYINGRASGGSTATRKVTLHKCVVVSAVEYEMKKDDKSLVKLVLQVLQDTAKSTGQQLFSVVDSGGDTTPPTVAMSSPAEGGSVSAGAKTVVQLLFTEAGSGIDEGTLVLGETVLVTDIEAPLASADVAGSISYNSSTKVLTFTPTSNWATAGNNYEITLTKGVKDVAGNALASVFKGHFVSA